MKVGLLTTEQKEAIEGKEFATDCKFNPIQDINGNWIISQEEMDMADVPPYDWVKNLPLIDYEPIITEL